jgi:hypothetical protein
VSLGALPAAAPRLPLRAPVFYAVVLAPPAVLGIARALPAEGAGLGLRLAAAAAVVLVVPGALLLRAIHWPDGLGPVLAGAVAWSLVTCGLALGLTFAAGGSLSLTLTLFAVIAGGALVAGLRAAPGAVGRDELFAVGALVAAGFVLCGIVWWTAATVDGEELFHLARVRKLDEVPALYSVRVANELRDASLHPGYGFPVWHGVLALVARLADVDPGLAVLKLGALLVPLALVLAYGAGAVLFASWAGGVATAVAQAAIVALPDGGTGAYRELALPEGAARLLLVPGLLCLVFAYVRSGRRVEVVTVVAAALALATVYPTYAVLACVPLAGFALARYVVGGEGRADVPRIGAALVAVLVPALLVALWLAPTIAETNAFVLSRAEKALAAERSGGLLHALGPLLSLEASAVARGGAGVIAGLLAVAAVPFAARRRWGAFVLGGMLAGLAVLLVPPLFTATADLLTLPQAQQLAVLLPLPFALAGVAVLGGRLRLVGCVAAAVLGAGLALAFSTDTQSGPAWAVWIAVAGALVGIVAARRRSPPAPGPRRWVIAAAVAFALPVAAIGLADAERDRPDERALTPGLVEFLRTRVPVRAVVFADPETSYRLAAAAPLYIVAAPPAYVARTERNRALERSDDVERFFSDEEASYVEKASLLAKYAATWLLVDRTKPVPAYAELLPRKAYEDGRFTLYRLRR